MDHNNLNLDFYNLMSNLSEYGIYIFICVVFGFGSLTYFLSIKAPNPVFESPKLSKKKTKKEKPLRSRNNKAAPTKIETKENVISTLAYVEAIIEPGKEQIEEESNVKWVPVIKAKKLSKSAKTISKDVKKEIHSIKKEEFKQPVIPNVSDKVELKPIESIEIIEKPIIQESVPIEEEDDEVIESRNVSESPTISLSDDYEIIDVYKTSSEDGLKVEIDSDITEYVEPIISSTSGASRKKNKKQQKLISKQLIEAAAIGESKSSSLPSISKSVPVVATGKKKRPRKDV